MIQAFDAHTLHEVLFHLAVGLTLPELAKSRHDTLRNVSHYTPRHRIPLRFRFRCVPVPLARRCARRYTRRTESASGSGVTRRYVAAMRIRRQGKERHLSK